MMGMRLKAFLAVVLAGVWAAACRPAPAVAPAPSPAAEALPRQVRTSPEAVAAARVDSARIPYTHADVRFMTDMIVHHAQAIRMSRMAATRGAGAQVQLLAKRIINAQQDEIAEMQQWLADRLKPWPHVDAAGEVHGAPAGAAGGHAGHGVRHGGMLTGEQMRQLEAARGAEFDRLFLRYMIQHHQGAVEMVRQLLDAGGAAHNATVFQLAGDINVDQTTEIRRMQQMLAAIEPTQRNN